MRVTAPPALTTNAADEIGLYGADVSGTITSDGGDGTGVKVLAFRYHRRGRQPLRLAKPSGSRAFAQGADYRGRLAGLFVGQQYYFRTAGRNNGGFGGLVWSSTKTFSTLSSLSPPNLGPLTASKASYFDAALNGSIVSTGGEYPQVKLFWETKTPGTFRASIRSTTASGIRDRFGHQGNRSFFECRNRIESAKRLLLRAYAVNSGGSTWSPVAEPSIQSPSLINPIVLPLGFLSTNPATTY